MYVYYTLVLSRVSQLGEFSCGGDTSRVTRSAPREGSFKQQQQQQQHAKHAHQQQQQAEAGLHLLPRLWHAHAQEGHVLVVPAGASLLLEDERRRSQLAVAAVGGVVRRREQARLKWGFAGCLRWRGGGAAKASSLGWRPELLGEGQTRSRVTPQYHRTGLT